MRPKLMLLCREGDSGILGSYGRAFARVGCQVEFWDFEAARSAEARLGALGALLHNLVTVEPWVRRGNRELVIEVLARRPDVLCVACISQVSGGALAQIRASSPGTKLVLFWPDPLQNLGECTVQALPLYDVVATYAASSVEPLRRLGANRVQHVPFGADTDLFLGSSDEKERQDDPDTRDEFACDVGFIANFRPEREAAVVALHESGLDVRVWGHDWERRAKNRRALPKYYRKRGLVGREFAAATRAFKVALNVVDPTNYPAANMRFFETLVSGGALLSSSCPEISTEFPDEVAAFYFESESQMVSRARALVGDAALRHVVANEGRRRVLAGHTYVHRAQQILGALNLSIATS